MMIDKISAMELDDMCDRERTDRPRRRRPDAQNAANTKERSLELEDVVRVLSSYSQYEGGINCTVCGKLYKSKVCLTKHLWEHSVYWDQFNDEKNHDRVLSIQAAIIMYAQRNPGKDAASLHALLVTSPHQNHEKRKDTNNNINNDNNTISSSCMVDPTALDSTAGEDDIMEFGTPQKRPQPKKIRSPCRNRSRKSPITRKGSKASVSSMTSLPGSVSPTFSLSDLDMSPSKSVREM